VGIGVAARRLLIVEDEPILAMMVVEQLAEIGCDVVGPAYTISEARRLALAAAFDAAIIDWNIRGTVSSEIAEILSRRQIPFLFVTGYDDLTFEARTNVVLNKPYTREALKDAVHNLLGHQNGSSQQATSASKLQKLDDASATLRWTNRAG
jgi:DNA-binding response OmpR family regulator